MSYHDQSKALQAVALLAIGCSECGITRDRSHRTRLSGILCWPTWSKLWPFRGLLLLGEGFLGSHSLFSHGSRALVMGCSVASSFPGRGSLRSLEG